jgi:hypothetical protein
MYADMMRRMQQKDVEKKKTEDKAAIARAADAEVPSCLASLLWHLIFLPRNPPRPLLLILRSWKEFESVKLDRLSPLRPSWSGR